MAPPQGVRQTGHHLSRDLHNALPREASTGPGPDLALRVIDPRRSCTSCAAPPTGQSVLPGAGRATRPPHVCRPGFSTGSGGASRGAIVKQRQQSRRAARTSCRKARPGMNRAAVRAWAASEMTSWWNRRASARIASAPGIVSSNASRSASGRARLIQPYRSAISAWRSSAPRIASMAPPVPAAGQGAGRCPRPGPRRRRSRSVPRWRFPCGEPHVTRQRQFAARAADPSPLGATRGVRYTLVITCRPAVRSNSTLATASEPSEMACAGARADDGVVDGAPWLRCSRMLALRSPHARV